MGFKLAVSRAILKVRYDFVPTGYGIREKAPQVSVRWSGSDPCNLENIGEGDHYVSIWGYFLTEVAGGRLVYDFMKLKYAPGLTSIGERFPT